MTHRLVVEPIGEEIEVEDGQTVLDACLRAGVWLPHACCHGLCGTCKVDVVEGDVEHGPASGFALMDFERDEGKTLACCATLQSDVTIEADIEEDPDAEYFPVLDHVGRVVRKEPLTPDIMGVWLEVPGDGVAFQAGQYVQVTLPVPGPPRAFSIASPPTEPNLIELHVRRVEGGVGTAWVHEQLGLGDEVPFCGPYGRFFVRKSAGKPMIFVAGGSGLSSPKSMILDLLEEGGDEPITLVQGARDRCDLYYASLWEELAGEHERFTWVPVLSQCGAPDDWHGELGFAHEGLERHFGGRFTGHKAYLCGPPPMIEASIRTLMKGRLFEKDIYTEKFVTAADGDAALARSPLFKRI